MIITIGYTEPYSNKVSNVMDFVNEAAILIQMYHMMCFTNFLYDPPTQSIVGMSMIITACANIVINVIVTTF